MLGTPESNPEHKIIIEIVDGLTCASGACEQLIHRHGDGNLNFVKLVDILEALKKVVTARATIPMFNHVKPAPMMGASAYFEDKPKETVIYDTSALVENRVDDKAVLATEACGENGGDGIVAIDSQDVDGGTGIVTSDGGTGEGGRQTHKERECVT